MVQGSRRLERMHPEHRSDISSQEEYWRNLVRIALPRFHETQRGERIGLHEIRERLGKIDRAGYDVGCDYRHDARERIWRVLARIRQEIAEKAGEYCPELLRKIQMQNKISTGQRDYWN